MMQTSELRNLINFITKPGYSFVHNLEELLKCPVGNLSIHHLIKFLEFNEDLIQNPQPYYDSKRKYFSTPIIKLNETEFLCPNFKFLIEAFYNRINEKLLEIKKEKYSQFKNKMLEKNTMEIFQRFFNSEAKTFTSFYFDEAKSEQDLLVIFKNNLLIIEIKDFKFRAPLRNPLKSFDKIKSDFKSGIQKAYDQCERFENKIYERKAFKIFDSKTNKELFEIRPNKVKNVFSIIVTQHKYGGIQTNLHELLVKDEKNLYPWSVCVDDLEIFLLGLKKIKPNNHISSFVEYLYFREAYHERLLCSDELEMCGLFINSISDFKKFATMEEIFNAEPRMSEIFDAHYRNGLGFPNEIDIEKKIKNPIGEYAKDFQAHVISGEEIL